MARKARKPVVDYAVYMAVRLVVGVVQALPMRAAFAVADGLAWLAYRVDKRHRAVAAENLRFAFPEKTAGEIDGIVRGCYRHFCHVVVEMVLLPRKFRMHNYPNYAELVNAGAVCRLLASREPGLFVTGHLGNWEMIGYALGAAGHKMFAVARVLDNPHLERFLKRFRQMTGQTIIAKKDDYDRLKEALEHGGKVCILADQDAGSRGMFVNFFGRPASAHKAVALLAMAYDAPIVVSAAIRVGEPMKYQMITEDVIRPSEYAGRPDAVKAMTQRYHAALERLARRAPEQYFWLHRRWKSRPVERKREVAKAA
jgi:Kdo2-lipid IVA lauroyltransferase/acyltransferase